MAKNGISNIIMASAGREKTAESSYHGFPAENPQNRSSAESQGKNNKSGKFTS
jgi:hypothetical protein